LDLPHAEEDEVREMEVEDVLRGEATCRALVLRDGAEGPAVAEEEVALAAGGERAARASSMSEVSAIDHA
jgi:hypothetical protein